MKCRWVFPKKKLKFFWKSPILAKIFQNAFQMVLLLHKSEKVQKLGLFGNLHGYSQGNTWYFSQSHYLATLLKNAFQTVLVFQKTQRCSNFGFFGKKNLLSCCKNRQLRQSFYRKYLEICYCLRVLKTLKKTIFAEKNGTFNKILANFQKQWKLLISSRRRGKSSYCPKFLKISDFGFFWKSRWLFWKQKPLKTFGNADLRKFFARLASYHCSWVLKTLKILGFFEKAMDFFRKAFETFQKHGYFASESDLKVFLAYAISKS